ncbi:GyrI-like domain-containing protein [Aquimarina sp. 2201CG5-10]|uniref:GyrI-like domain-containing protein n=1 Tax=Aquimarina callyspongiae TaxID=3098150 RepID=UPI002AB4E84C|nr:GyrI-like domain-containing protein [Aquimarina sp. 2201CG5-10]MDY8134223.1 GyrI-like domain-containing protein [Aquimarina sp. 2201CG5-10]
MTNKKFESFPVIGISVRTNNHNQNTSKDIEQLWATFMNEGIINKIPHKLDNTIYAIYTDYESDYTQDYTLIIGCKVEHLDTIPEGMTSTTVQKGNYSQFTAKGDVTKGAIYEEWLKIWQSDLNRSYTTDFEVYGMKAQNPQNAEVDIFIALE